MNKFKVPTLCSGLFLLQTLTSPASVSAQDQSGKDTKKPNIIVFYVDDLGYTDLGCMGSDYYQTPNIDKFATESMLFDNAYAPSPVCGPSRLALMTGKYPARLHMSSNQGCHLPHKETSIAEALKKNGYVTASIGKWHLGGKDGYPEDHGFDYNIAGFELGGISTYSYPYTHSKYPDGIPNIEGGEEGEYITDRLTDEAIKIMNTHKDEPFFIYLSHYVVHWPHIAKQKDVFEYLWRLKGGLKHFNPEYAAMIHNVDVNFQKILDEVNELGISDNTLIIFTSDNGGAVDYPHATSNYPLRNGKGTLYEGGLRVPFIVKWPGNTPAGSISHEPINQIDLFPTFLEMAGTPVQDKTVDGLSLTPIFKNPNETLHRDALYFHYNTAYVHVNRQNRRVPSGAMREGDWKMIHFYRSDLYELYNLKDDIGEINNLAVTYPGKLNEMKTRFLDWKKSINAREYTDEDYKKIEERFNTE